MNIGNTLARIFPTGVVSDGSPDQGGFFEVRGLPQDTIPQNCEILASGYSPNAIALERRGSFLVKTADFVLFFHICIAHPDSGDAEFVMGRLCAHADAARLQELQAYALMTIKAVRPSPIPMQGRKAVSQRWSSLATACGPRP